MDSKSYYSAAALALLPLAVACVTMPAGSIGVQIAAAVLAAAYVVAAVGAKRRELFFALPFTALYAVCGGLLLRAAIGIDAYGSDSFIVAVAGAALLTVVAIVLAHLVGQRIVRTAGPSKGDVYMAAYMLAFVAAVAVPAPWSPFAALAIVALAIWGLKPHIAALPA